MGRFNNIENLSYKINKICKRLLCKSEYIINMNNIRKYGGAWVYVFRYIHNCQSF
jgi:hypothetical protein